MHSQESNDTRYDTQLRGLSNEEDTTKAAEAQTGFPAFSALEWSVVQKKFVANSTSSEFGQSPRKPRQNISEFASICKPDG